MRSSIWNVPFWGLCCNIKTSCRMGSRIYDMGENRFPSCSKVMENVNDTRPTPYHSFGLFASYFHGYISILTLWSLNTCGKMYACTADIFKHNPSSLCSECTSSKAPRCTHSKGANHYAQKEVSTNIVMFKAFCRVGWRIHWAWWCKFRVGESGVTSCSICVTKPLIEPQPPKTLQQDLIDKEKTNI